MNLKRCIEGDQTTFVNGAASVPTSTAIAPASAVPSSVTVTAAAVIFRMVPQAATVAARAVTAGAAEMTLPAQFVQREPAKDGRASQQDQDPDLVFHGPISPSVP